MLLTLMNGKDEFKAVPECMHAVEQSMGQVV
jgi:hypothetical protein